MLPTVTDYGDYVIHPMDLKTMENKAKNREYKCIDSFLADVSWIGTSVRHDV